MKDSLAFVIMFWRSDSSESSLDLLAGVGFFPISRIFVQILFSWCRNSALNHFGDRFKGIAILGMRNSQTFMISPLIRS